MERREIAIVGGGFAGVWAAMGAARRLQREQAHDRVRITLVGPDDALVIRPRLYEADLGGVLVPLDGVLAPVGVEHRRASVEGIDVDARRLTLVGGGSPGELDYDQLVICAGSKVRLPDGAEGVHSADSYGQSVALHQALAEMGEHPEGPFSATVVGAGFTGIELAAELSDMLRAAAGAAGPPAEVSVHLVDQAATVAPEFGPRARTVITDALASLGVQTHTGVPVSRIDAGGATLADGRRMDSALTVWAGGPRASALNEQLGTALDPHGRVEVDAQMATGADGVWAAGDSARVRVDERHLAMMSCQQAMPQGRQAGDNAAAAVLGRPPGRYRQPLYLTCLDLGSAGGLLTCGFERDSVLAAGEQAKRFKRFINRSLIYPPVGGDAEELLRLGKPATPGPAAAKIQQLALRSDALRSAVITRGEDRAGQYSVEEVPS
jgi:NADH dehydrogenase